MTESASVKVFSAEIRVLQVGNGQITRSMYRQLDDVSLERFEAFGRVKDNKVKSGEGVLRLVGRDTRTAALVRHDPQPPDWSAVDGPSEFAHWLLHTDKNIRLPCPVAGSSDGRRIVWTGRSNTHCPNRLGWHISQKRPRGLPYAEYWEEPKRQTKKFCTVGLVELE